MTANNHYKKPSPKQKKTWRIRKKSIQKSKNEKRNISIRFSRGKQKKFQTMLSCCVIYLKNGIRSQVAFERFYQQSMVNNVKIETMLLITSECIKLTQNVYKNNRNWVETEFY